MPNNHPITNHWSSEGEKTVNCSKCAVAVDNLEFVADVLVKDSQKKTYIFYHFSRSSASYTLGCGLGGGGLSLSGSTTIQEGTPLIKALRRDGRRHMCVSCFEKEFPIVFKSVAISLNGLAVFVNSDYTLNRASYGAGM